MDNVSGEADGDFASDEVKTLRDEAKKMNKNYNIFISI